MNETYSVNHVKGGLVRQFIENYPLLKAKPYITIYITPENATSNLKGGSISRKAAYRMVRVH